MQGQQMMSPDELRRTLRETRDRRDQQRQEQMDQQTLMQLLQLVAQNQQGQPEQQTQQPGKWSVQQARDNSRGDYAVLVNEQTGEIRPLSAPEEMQADGGIDPAQQVAQIHPFQQQMHGSKTRGVHQILQNLPGYARPQSYVDQNGQQQMRIPDSRSLIAGILEAMNGGGQQQAPAQHFIGRGSALPVGRHDFMAPTGRGYTIDVQNQDDGSVHSNIQFEPWKDWQTRQQQPSAPALRSASAASPELPPWFTPTGQPAGEPAVAQPSMKPALPALQPPANTTQAEARKSAIPSKRNFNLVTFPLYEEAQRKGIL